MQTRIKVTETVGGSKFYQIQKRRDFMWGIYIIPVYGWFSFFIDLLMWDDVWAMWDKDINYHTSEEEAKKSIDKFYRDKEKEKQAKINSRTKKTTYIKYP